MKCKHFEKTNTILLSKTSKTNARDLSVKKNLKPGHEYNRLAFSSRHPRTLSLFSQMTYNFVSVKCSEMKVPAYDVVLDPSSKCKRYDYPLCLNWAAAANGQKCLCITKGNSKEWLLHFRSGSPLSPRREIHAFG